MCVIQVCLPELPWRYASEAASPLLRSGASSTSPTSVQRAGRHQRPALSCRPPSSAFPRTTIGQDSLAMNDRAEVSPLSRRAMLPPVSRPLQPGFRFLRIPLHGRSHVLVVPIHPLLLSAFVLADSALPRGSAYRLPGGYVVPGASHRAVASSACPGRERLMEQPVSSGHNYTSVKQKFMRLAGRTFSPSRAARRWRLRPVAVCDP